MDSLGTVTKVVAAGAITVGALLVLGFIADRLEEKKPPQPPQGRAPQRNQQQPQQQQQQLKKRTEAHDFDTNLLIAKELVARNDPSAERFLLQLSSILKQKKDWKRAGLAQALLIEFYSINCQEANLALIFLDSCKNKVKQNSLAEIEEHIEQKLLTLPWAHPESTSGFLMLLAKIQYYLGKDEKAQETVRQYLAKNQTQKGNLFMGKVHFLANKFDDAERYFKAGLSCKATQDVDLTGLLHSHLSNLYSHLSRKEESSQSLVEALAGPPVSYLTFSYYVSTKTLEISREKEGHSMARVVLKLRSKRQEGGPEDDFVAPIGALLVSRLVPADGSEFDLEDTPHEKTFEVKPQKSNLVPFYFRLNNRPTVPLLLVTEIYHDKTKELLLAEHKQLIFANKNQQ